MSENRNYLDVVAAGIGVAPARKSFREDATRDWPWICASARRHRLSSLLWEGARRLALTDRLPAEVRHRLERAYYAHAVHHHTLTDVVQPLLDAAKRAGIRCALLKGVSFGAWLYPSPALRPVGDIDVLIAPRDLAALARLAEEHGFGRHQETDHALSMQHRHSELYLELHTSLTSCPAYIDIDTERLLERARPVPHSSSNTLAPDDHLLHLCLHASFQHGFRQPAINAIDVALLSRLPELDWERFVGGASARRLAPLVHGGLAMSHRVFPTGPTRQALDALAGQVPARLRHRTETLDRHALLSPAADSVFGSPWLRLTYAPRWADALSLLRESLSGTKAGQPESRCSVQRGLALFWRHGPSRWAHRLLRRSPVAQGPYRPASLTPVSLGDSSHV